MWGLGDGYFYYWAKMRDPSSPLALYWQGGEAQFSLGLGENYCQKEQILWDFFPSQHF